MTTPAPAVNSAPTVRSTLQGPVLLIGARGMLGRAWSELLGRSPVRSIAPDRQSLDLARPVSIEPLVDGSCPVVVNCAAWTDVDGAEANEAAATAVNGEGVRLLAERCAAVGATLVTYGTDYVFDGLGTAPYPTDHPRSPLNAYGRSKAVGEAALERSGASWLHIRTSWLYAPWGKNFVRTIAKAGRERPELRVVDDQFGRPTSAEHLAGASVALLESGGRGHWHITDGGECSWFEFAREVVRLTGGTARVSPCRSEEFPRPARRPAYSVLDLSATESRLGPMPDWLANVGEAVARGLE